jgi:hypothetical protein
MKRVKEAKMAGNGVEDVTAAWEDGGLGGMGYGI